ncbi:MAG: hypothetical protein JNK46_02385 [Methylobacteriaceae bacterium]|nr:hypothetical protein [Methylobacteriaceae bacterium]
MMALLAPLVAYVADEARGLVRRRASIAAGYAVAGLGGLGLVIVGLVSLHRFASGLWGPYGGDLTLAGVMVAVILAGWLYARAQARKPAPEAAGGAMAAAAAAAPAAVGLMRGGRAGLAAAAIAILAGVLAGRAAKK